MSYRFLIPVLLLSITCLCDQNILIMGNNIRGAVGDGTYTNVPQPLEISSKTVLAANQYTSVACGSMSTFVYFAGQGDIYGWVACF